MLTVNNICDGAENFTPEEEFENDQTWTDPRETCPALADDLAAYNIYYATTEGAELQVIETVNTPNEFDYTDRPELGIAGCYAVTAIDSVGNESVFSNIVCVDNCPAYELPNAFTPNSDGSNDDFRGKGMLDGATNFTFTIWNRWGEVLFQTNNPEQAWNGRKNNTGKLSPNGVYVCIVTFDGPRGEPFEYKGLATLIR